MMAARMLCLTPTVAAEGAATTDDTHSASRTITARDQPMRSPLGPAIVDSPLRSRLTLKNNCPSPVNLALMRSLSFMDEESPLDLPTPLKRGMNKASSTCVVPGGGFRICPPGV